MELFSVLVSVCVNASILMTEVRNNPDCLIITEATYEYKSHDACHHNNEIAFVDTSAWLRDTLPILTERYLELTEQVHKENLETIYGSNPSEEDRPWYEQYKEHYKILSMKNRWLLEQKDIHGFYSPYDYSINVECTLIPTENI